MSVPAAFNRDENFVPIQGLGFTSTKSITYAAGTTGAVGTTTLFTVTGIVAVRLLAFTSDSLTGAGTIEVGTTGSTAALLGQINAADLDTNDVWTLTDQATSALLSGLYVTGEDIFQTIGTDTVTVGHWCITHYGSLLATMEHLFPRKNGQSY